MGTWECLVIVALFVILEGRYYQDGGLTVSTGRKLAHEIIGFLGSCEFIKVDESSSVLFQIVSRNSKYHELQLIVLVVEKILRSARAVQVAAPSTDQSRTLDIPILFHMLGLVIQINSSSPRVSLAVKVWAKTRQCSANLGDPTARCWIPNPLPHSSYGSLALFETYYGRQNTLRSTCMIG